MSSPVDTEQLPEACHRTKRRRGGQAGNRNARKHGFYARSLNPTEICEFWNIVNTEGLEPEVAALRVKLRSVIEHDPCNRRVLREASKLIARWYSSKYRLNKTDSSAIKKLVWGILQNYLNPLPSHPEQSQKQEEILT